MPMYYKNKYSKLFSNIIAPFISIKKNIKTNYKD